MDQFFRAYYELAFETAFLRKKGNAFQDFFADVMGLRYPADFFRVRPWGKHGDRKNDGYLKSKRTLFQVYAPNELTAGAAIAKIDEDFTEALPHWKQHFDTWVFTHNAAEGLGPDVTKKLLDLDAAHPPTVTHWGFTELRREVFALSDADVAKVLGPCPTQQNFTRLSFDSLRPVIESLSKGNVVADGEIRPVPEKKIEANALSSHVSLLLRTGMQKAQLVEQFFRTWHDPELGDQIAARFKNEYEQLRDSGTAPDQIFRALVEFAGGTRRGSAAHETAVLAIVAYFFEQCEIFERPEEEPT